MSCRVVWCCLVLSCLVVSCRVVVWGVLCCVGFGSVVLCCLSGRVVSCVPCRVMSCLVLCCVICVVLSGLVLSVRVWSCRVLSCLVLSCLIYHHQTRFFKSTSNKNPPLHSFYLSSHSPSPFPPHLPLAQNLEF